MISQHAAGKAIAVGVQTCQYLLWVYKQQAVPWLKANRVSARSG